jgi:hypothetical protein
MNIRIVVLCCALALLCPAQQAPMSGPVALLDHLAGDWVLTGKLGNRQTTHDVHAQWVLNHEYLQFHEISREKNAQGDPAYEAIVTIEWNEKRHEFVCQWLDSTEGGGLYGPLGHAQPMPSSVPFIFTISPAERLETTFAYTAAADTWRLTIDDVANGKTDRFGDVQLARKR